LVKINFFLNPSYVFDYQKTIKSGRALAKEAKTQAFLKQKFQEASSPRSGCTLYFVLASIPHAEHVCPTNQ
jgi:hypothetical protein